MSTAVRSLDAVWGASTPYPGYALDGCETGLCLFAARFYGANDAIHMERAGMELDIVDISDRVIEMGEMYGCRPYVVDAWVFAENARACRSLWDVVSVDTYTGDATTRSLSDLELWCSLARRVVTCTHVRGQRYDVPDGWTDSLMVRRERGGINWLVLTRA